jgi:hypothetical protein
MDSSMHINSTSEQEWVTLQNQQDSYEKYSLLIKLFHVLVIFQLLIFPSNLIVLPIISVILWVQDAIWKTFQNRISERLLQIETAIAAKDHNTGMQFNRDWLENRRSGLALIKEYFLQMIRPTMVFPHAFLLSLSLYIIL